MAIKNGTKTYSKTPFKGSKHPRGKGGSFKKKARTEEESVSYHHKFSGSSHPRGNDGTFNSAAPVALNSDGTRLGYKQYGPK